MRIKVYEKDSAKYLRENGKDVELTLNPNWITNDKGLDINAVRFAENFGKYLVDPFWDNRNNRVKAGRNSLTTNQLRNFFGEIRRIQMKGFKNHITDFYMLKPKLAYAEARVTSSSQNNRIKEFAEALSILIDKVVETEKEEHFENFVKFVEATVAYHKAFGGKD